MAKRSLASSKIQLDLEDDDNMNVEYAPGIYHAT